VCGGGLFLMQPDADSACATLELFSSRLHVPHSDSGTSFRRLHLPTAHKGSPDCNDVLVEHDYLVESRISGSALSTQWQKPFLSAQSYQCVRNIDFRLRGIPSRTFYCQGKSAVPTCDGRDARSAV